MYVQHAGAQSAHAWRVSVLGPRYSLLEISKPGVPQHYEQNRQRVFAQPLEKLSRCSATLNLPFMIVVLPRTADN